MIVSPENEFARLDVESEKFVEVTVYQRLGVERIALDTESIPANAMLTGHHQNALMSPEPS